MIRCVIIDDSRLARIELREMLGKYKNVDIIAEAGSAKEAKEIIDSESPDLLFLDIQMPGKSGFELLAELDKVPAIVFTTAFDQYAIQSFEYNTVDYLLKPISDERLDIAIERAQERIDSVKISGKKLTDDSSVFVKDGDKCWFVKVRDIFLLESKGNYTQIFFEDNRPLVLKSLSHFESVLDNTIYFRINRSQIINLKYIDKVVAWFNGRLKLRLKDGTEVEVSRRQTDKIKDMFSF
ncbi:MAG: LytTR family transcriptional regulator DNA-binding domain-containing protein [Bacteroidales bacterium]|nr:LytTR family transcriptional regulator DNA-binding domain-containing protein [Bacteroidales bacterium]